jgi:MFS family permease
VPSISPLVPSGARGRLRGALRNSFIDGVLSSFSGAIVDSFAIAALLSLGAGNRSVALLAGVAALLAAVAQLLSPRIAAAVVSRRAMVVRCACLQAGAILLFAAAGFLRSPDGQPDGAGTGEGGGAGAWSSGLAIAAAVLAYAVYQVAVSVPRGAWASWMSELVPLSGRGRYFSWRTLWLAAVYGAVALAVGNALKLAGASPSWAVFAAIFVAAGLGRLAGSVFVARQYEPPAESRAPAADFTYWQFLARSGSSNFARFTVCFALLCAAASLTGPFFQVYFLRDLKDVPMDGLASDLWALAVRGLAWCGWQVGASQPSYDLGAFVLLPTVSLASRLCFIRFWGRVADRWGNMLVLRICAIGLTLFPLLYLGPPRFTLMVLVFAIGGICWGGLDLACFNFVMEAVTPQRRGRCLSFMEGTVGVAVAIYAFAGGWLMEHLPLLCGYRAQSLFLLSVGLRLLPALGLILLIREVRKSRPEFSMAAVARDLPLVSMLSSKAAAKPARAAFAASSVQAGCKREAVAAGGFDGSPDESEVLEVAGVVGATGFEPATSASRTQRSNPS